MDNQLKTILWCILAIDVVIVVSAFIHYIPKIQMVMGY